jgi:hypothetical protein
MPEDEYYIVNWHPDPGLALTRTYRIRVLFRSHEGVAIEKELGHADVTPAAMVIKFRIEEGFFPVGELTPKERAKISPVLQRYVAAHDTFGPFKVILTLSDVHDTLGKQAGILVLREFGPTLPNAVVQIGSPEDMALVARNPKVEFVSENRLYRLIEVRSQGVIHEPCAQLDGNIRIETAAQDTPTPAQMLIGQPCAQQNGYIGTGTAVAVLDAGIDLTDPAFSGIQVISEPMDLPLNQDLRCDGDAWHGTLVAKQVAQVAPGAVLIMLDVQAVDGFIDQGCGMSLDCFLRAATWILEHQKQYNIVAMNMSYAKTGGSYSTEDCSLYWQEEMTLENLRNHGIMPFAGSGNDGLLQGVSSPACTPSVISVAAVIPATDEIWSGSTRGSNLDLLAPGCEGACGTSLASPIAAGAWAVMRSAHPELGLNETLELLKATGVPIYDPATELTFPRVQLDAALGLTECDPIVIYDNGISQRQWSSGSGVGQFLAADDFVLGIAMHVTGASVDVADGPPELAARWDGTIEWWLLDDNGGVPGALIASGTGQNIQQKNMWESRLGYRQFTVDFDFGQEIPLPGGRRFWFALHMHADFSDLGVWWDDTYEIRPYPSWVGGELIDGVPNFVDGQYARTCPHDKAFRLWGHHE